MRAWLLLLLPLVAAAPYADLDIAVEPDGLVTITGTTDREELLVERTPELTSKRGAYWLFNLTVDEQFSEFIYTLTLPEGAEVNYLRTRHVSRIEPRDGGVRIIGTGRNESLVVLVQYRIRYGEPRSWAWLLLPAAALLAYLVIRRKRAASKPYREELLTERQLAIVRALEAAGKPLTQHALERATGLPKSSLSRNVDSLARRGVLVKERKGMSNLVSFRSVPERSGEER